MLQPTDDAPQPSLFKDLAEGRAGIPVRILVAIALGVLLAGVGLVFCYWLAAIVPYWNRTYYYRTITGAVAVQGAYPRDELIAMVMLLAGALWLGAVLWLFFKHSSRRGLLKPIIVSVVILAVTIFLGILADDALRGDREYVIVGVCLIAGAAITLVWVQAVRRMTAGRPLRHHQDQHPDVRCPQCGYRMVGLYESRCPECGTAYTLDELIARQNFAEQDLRTTTAPPPPVPTPAGNTSVASA
jgi:DNA-directed RNA polymerase subunit RPC12/RpoP